MLGSMTRWQRRATAIGALVVAGSLLAPGAAPAQEVPSDPEDVLELFLEVLGALVPPDLPDPVDQTDPLNPACDPLDTAQCLLPFPSDHWTVPADTPTGLRVELPIVAMPRNVLGVPVDPTEWNRNDGWSPGSALLTFVPGLDLVATWGLGDRAARYQDQMTDPALSTAADAPIVLVDADTGERHPFLSELDTHEATNPDARLLIVRPAVNLLEGHRYVIGLRDLVDDAGQAIEAGPAFAALRDGTAGGARQRTYDDEIFPVLEAAGVERGELFLAWDLTIASEEGLSSRALAIRDDAFALLGDDDLADGVVDGDAPTFTVDEVEDRSDPEDATARVVRGTLTVPNYLNVPGEAAIEIPDVGAFPVPGARFVYDTLTPGAGDTPIVNELAPTRTVPWVCSIPRTAFEGLAATPALYGHGLLGSQQESLGGSTQGLRANGYMPCSVDWTGMATGDLPNVALILADISRFPSLADRAQQGFLEFLMLGRALVHPDGLVTDPAFQAPGEEPLFTAGGLVYDGNSQGGIMGGALTALGVDFTRATLGVPGMNYSTLLNRSVDWEGSYASASYAFYPSKQEQQLVFGLLQMLWDRAEANGYAQHMTDDPLADTPAKQVLMQVGFGDHQVSNLAAEVEARTIGARRIATDIPRCRHWAVDLMYGFEANDPTAAEPAVLAYWDSGTPRSPNGNRPPTGYGEDPHEDVRRAPLAIEQKVTFYETGRVVDTAGGEHARSHVWPEAAGAELDTVLAEVEGGCAVTPSEPAAPATQGAGQGRLPATGGTGSSATTAAAAVVAALALAALRRAARVRG